MAIKKYAGDKIVGLSSDIKPNNIPDGATYYESDTLRIFIKTTTNTWNRVANTIFTTTISTTSNVSANIVIANTFIGDGSKLTGIDPTPTVFLLMGA